MKKNITILIFFLISMITPIQAQDWLGSWEGVLDAGTQKLRIVFHIKQDENGKLQALMDSPDQLAYDLKMDDVIVKDGEITINFIAAHAQYLGKLSEDKTSIQGNWNQGVPFPLNLTKSKNTGPKRPQNPKEPYSYNVEKVSYDNSKANIKLAGTLTLPKGGGKYPAVILISGSGPQDRDETILKHKPFWVLADFLSKNGIAVLRFDDRGVGESGGKFAGATSADFATDVAAGLAFLKTHPNIDSKKIGLMGHSEGGMIAPIVASKDKTVAFVVMLAGLGVPGHELLLQQNRDIMTQKEMQPSHIEILQKINEKFYAAIVKDTKNALGVSDLMDAAKAELAAISAEDKAALGLEDATLRQSVAVLLEPWMRYFLKFKPADYLSKVKCPILAINGDKDIQVAAKINLPAIENTLKKAKHKNFKCESLPNLNHLFQTCTTGAIDEYVEIEETFSPAAMDLILKWLKERG